MSRRLYFVAGLGGAVAGALVARAAVDQMVMDTSRPPQRGGGISLVFDPEPTTLVAFTDSAILFSVATVISFHSTFADPNQMIHFLKNVLVAGGLLQIAAFGGGVLSVGNRRKSGGRGSSAALAPEDPSQSPAPMVPQDLPQRNCPTSRRRKPRPTRVGEKPCPAVHRPCCFAVSTMYSVRLIPCDDAQQSMIFSTKTLFSMTPKAAF